MTDGNPFKHDSHERENRPQLHKGTDHHINQQKELTQLNYGRPDLPQKPRQQITYCSYTYCSNKLTEKLASKNNNSANNKQRGSRENGNRTWALSQREMEVASSKKNNGS